MHSPETTVSYSTQSPTHSAANSQLLSNWGFLVLIAISLALAAITMLA